MGAFDTLSKAYLKDPHHFADAVNFLLFNGDDIVHPSELRELDPTEIALTYGNDANEPVQKIRDIAKMWTGMYDDNAVYLILGIENQSKIHYAIAVKNMVYDALNYAKQVIEAKKSRRGESETSEEFLSGFHKEDKLIPVITLVIYFGSEEWDGPKSLYDMFDIKDQRILKYVSDYKVNLIEPYSISPEDFTKFKTELGKVMEYIKYSKDKVKINQLVHDDAQFWKIHKESFDLINQATNSRLKPILDEGGNVNMCMAIDEMKKDSEIVGVVKFLMNEMHLSLDEAIGKAAQSFAKTKEYVEQLVKEAA